MKLKILSIVSFAIVMMLCISHIEANTLNTNNDGMTAYIVEGQL